jgi:hypothetical protein
MIPPMSLVSAEPLRMKAVDAADVTVLSACLQDSLVLIDDLTYLPDEKRFALVANRFTWEHSHAGGTDLRARVKCGVGFENVTRVLRQGVNRDNGDGLLVLLSIEVRPGALHLTFAGGAAIRLEVSDILCHLQDLGESWPTPWRPDHDREPKQS